MAQNLSELYLEATDGLEEFHRTAVDEGDRTRKRLDESV